MEKTTRLVLVVFLFGLCGWAQNVNIAAKLGYPQMIVYNGKIVTVDDPSFESRVGTIVQAMAIRDNKILATGNDVEIRALAGPQTKQLDLKGRMVLPSFIMTHEHPTDWAFAEPDAMMHVIPPDNDFMIVRWLKGPAAEQFAQWEGVLKEAATKAKPGQWIWLSFFRGGNYEYQGEIDQRFSEVVTRQRLDQLVPNSPVEVKRGWVLGPVVNSKGAGVIQKEYPEWPKVAAASTTAERLIEPDIILKWKTPLLADLLKAELELWAAQGITVIASAPYTYHNLQALALLDRKGELPVRFGWGYRGMDDHRDTIRYIASLLGQGTDYLWNVGAWTVPSGSCTSINAAPEVKNQESCSFEPGSDARKVMEEIIRNGGRIATMHSGGDKDIDNLMDMIVKASKEAGFSMEEIRSKRHVFDHSGLAPRPDQIPMLKNLGMMVSMNNQYLWAGNSSQVARRYGIEYTNWIVPRNSATKGGVMTTYEIDRPLPHKLFLFVQKGITRYNDKDQKVNAPGERTDRIIQLKALTTWGSYNVLREKALGSLEPGKLADFVVLDRDFLTIPVDDIPNIHVLMTVVGGKTIHLMPDLGREFGMPPVGPAVWETKPLENYYAH